MLWGKFVLSMSNHWNSITNKIDCKSIAIKWLISEIDGNQRSLHRVVTEYWFSLIILIVNGNHLVMHLSMLSPRGEPAQAYVGHLTFQKNFWSNSPLWGPKIWSNLIKYPLPLESMDKKCLIHFQCLIPWRKLSPYHQWSPQSKVFHQLILKISTM